MVGELADKLVIVLESPFRNRIVRYIGNRLLFFIPQLIGITILTFVVIRLLPGDPASRILGSMATPEQLQALRERYGLNESIWVQYKNWIVDLLHGNLGISYMTGNPVVKDIAARFPATLELISISLVLSIVIMIPLGILIARPPGGRISEFAKKIVFGYGLLSGALPDFWVGLILLFVFYTTLRWAPAPLGRLDASMLPPRHFIGFYTVDSVLCGDWAALKSAVLHLILPVATLVFVYGGPVLKLTQSTMAFVLGSPHISHAKALGLQDRTVSLYAFRNVLPPIATLVGINTGFLLGGAVLVETVFSWGGLGQYAVQAVLNADFTAIQGFVIVAAAFTIVIYLLVDIIYLVVDPRIGR